MHTLKFTAVALAGCAALVAGPAAAAIIQVSSAAFTPSAGLITFSEQPLNTTNPTYTAAQYGGGAGAPTVTFGGFFNGQSLGAGATCPAGAALTGCVVGSPTGPLTLSASSPSTFITNDGSNPSSPVLSGTPQFNGPIAIQFSTPQFGVGLDGGFFNAIGGTAITAYDINGVEIGTVANTQLGIEFLGLVTSDNSATISGLLFHLVGSEPAGFAVDNIRFGVQGQVVVPGAGVPEPATWTMMIVGFGLVGAGLRLRRRSSPLAA